MKKTTLYIIVLLFSVSITGQNLNRKYKSHNEEGGMFTVVTNDGKFVFQFYSEDILETTFIPQPHIF